jgi:hypothetical protein
MDFYQTKHIRHHPWCVDDDCALGWVIAMSQADVLGKAAGHLGAQNWLSESCNKHQKMGNESLVEVQ